MWRSTALQLRFVGLHGESMGCEEGLAMVGFGQVSCEIAASSVAIARSGIWIQSKGGECRRTEHANIGTGITLQTCKDASLDSNAQF